MLYAVPTRLVVPKAGIVTPDADIALTSAATWLSSKVLLSSVVLNCSTWYWLPEYQFCTVNLSAVPMKLASRSLPTWRNQIWSFEAPARKRA